MRIGVLQRIISRLLWFAVVCQIAPLVVALLDRESIWWAYAIPGVLSGALAVGFSRLAKARGNNNDTLRRREGFLAVTLGWMTLVFVTALSLYLTGEFVGFSEAFFESMSGFTTTGATIFTDIESLPASILFVRSFSHWIGGMGIIVLSVAILPELRVGGMQLFAAESSGLDADKLAPRIAQTARRLWVLYFAITLVLTILLRFGGMSLFDSLNHAMATIATGGFSTKNQSIASFDSVYIEMVILAFMFLSGIGFTLQYRAIILGQPKRLLQSSEVKLYTALTASACFLITLNIYTSSAYDDLLLALRHASFQTVSIITTTGFGTADFNKWPAFSKLMLVGLMLIGGCAGSTAGGSKVIRLYIVTRHAIAQMRRLIRPRLAQSLYIGDRELGHETTEGVLGYYLLYIAIIMILGLAMTALGMNLVSGTTAAVSAMNSIGPGLGSVGATQNFGHVHDLGLYLLSCGMLLGRLEIYTVLILFTGHFWRRG